MINGNLEELLVLRIGSLLANKTTLAIKENGSSVTISVNG
ncbi:MAG: hypothetical protein ACJAY2_001526 [Pseudomonadales bacterium]|jgi:hypothetical protein